MKLISIGDEQILQTLCVEVLFTKEWIGDIDQTYLEVLKRFGFCLVDKKSEKPKRLSHYITFITSEEMNDQMLPLKPDWFIRPLFYINSPEESIQILAQSIFKFIELSLESEKLECLCVNPSILVYLITYFITKCYVQTSGEKK